MVMDITDYKYVNSILNQYELDLKTIEKIPVFSLIIDNKKSLAGYKFYENGEYFGAIFFMNSSETEYNKMYAIFDENGNMLHFQPGKSKPYPGVWRGRESSDFLSGYLETKRCRMVFDEKTDKFKVVAKTKYKTNLTADIVSHPGNVVFFFWSSVRPSDDIIKDHIESLSKVDENIFDKKFVSFFHDKNDFIDVKKDVTDYFLLGGDNSIFGCICKDDTSCIKDYYKRYKDAMYDGNFHKYIVIFSINKDIKVLQINHTSDLEHLSVCYPTDKALIGASSINADLDQGCEFVDWEKLSVDYDAVYVSKRLRATCEIPGIIILNKKVINKYNIVEVDKYFA